VEVSQGLPSQLLEPTLQALVDAGRVGWVVLLLEDARPLIGPAPAVGQRVLGGRLEIVAHVVANESCAGAVLLRVVVS
jgi:hypothetical protein